jgi:hypothetical protein
LEFTLFLEEEEEIEEAEGIEEIKEREAQHARELQAEISGKSFERTEQAPKKKVKVNQAEENIKLAEMMLTKKQKGRYIFHKGIHGRKNREVEALVEKRKRNEENVKNPKKSKSQ